METGNFGDRIGQGQIAPLLEPVQCECRDQKSPPNGDDDFPTLDPGESAAITICLGSEAILLTDDFAAREVATNLGIEVYGSIGVVLYGDAHDHLDASEAKTLIRSLKRDTTLYLADPLVEYALRVIEADYDGWQ